MITVRLPQELEEEINRFVKTENKTKTDIVKEALNQYLREHRQRKSAYELGADLFGAGQNADPDLSSTYKTRLKRRLHEKHLH